MAYENIDGFVCDMDGETCLAKYDFGDAEFKVKFFEFLDSVEKFEDKVAEKLPEGASFLDRSRIELDVSNEIFTNTDVLLGEGFRERHVGNKSIYRLARAIGELANVGVEAVGRLVDDTETMVKSYVNRAQKRAAAKSK